MSDELKNTDSKSKINKKELKEKIHKAVKMGDFAKAARFKKALLAK